MKKSFLIFLSALLLISTTCFTACDSWMQDDDFYGDIENDVKVANAATVSAYVRYANSKMGTTTPSGYFTFKEDVPSTLTAVTNDDYGFVRWAAFSTNDFPAAQQHSNLFYENADKYAEEFQPLELPASEVIFSDPDKTTTKITLETTRSDIFITPLVAKRPTIVTSVPSNGRTDVVKNSQVRILFSKPIDETSLKDEFGNYNIQITSGRAVLTESSDDLSALDITNYFDFKLSKSRKMLTISAKKGSDGKAIYKFDNNAQISITLFEDLKDTDGYAMNGSYKFSFTTGTKEDSLAPKIETITAGIGQKCLDYQQYKYNVANAKFTSLAESAPNTLSTYHSDDSYVLAQRVKDKVNIFVRATDIAGAGAGVTLDNNNQSENDVALLQVRASLYADKDGNPVTTSTEAFANGSIGTDTSSVLYIREYGYVLGMKDSDCQVRGAFETVTATQPDPNNAGQFLPNYSGTLFTYDLSTLADGLIKIDVWAVDMVGNSGDAEVYSDTYNNGYRSIFVVKDSTPPDAATEKTKIEAQENTAAPYKWFNYNSLSTMQIADKATDLIQDANHEYLSSDINKLKWIFKVGNDPNWAPSPADSAWTAIHTASNQPIVKTLTEAAASTDGPVDITMCLKDDLDNVSAPVLLNSIMYDNTAPVLSTPGWVKKTSTTSYTYEDLVATTSESNLTTSGHVLKIPFTEEWAGLRRIKLTVQKGGTGDAVVQDNYSIAYVPASGTGRALTYTAGSDSTLKILSVDDDTAVKTGNLYISGIKIGSATGTYRVKVELWDSSLNHSETYADISIDTTDPVLSKVYIPGLKKAVSATSSGASQNATLDGYFLPKEYVKGPDGTSSDTAVAPGYIPLYLFINEKDSGIHKISFASTDSVALFSSDSKSTTLYKIDNFGQAGESRTQLPASDYTIDVTNKTITLIDNPSVKLSSSSDNGFVLLVKDIGFKEVIKGENTIDVTVTDLATLSGNNFDTTLNKPAISPYSNSTTQITGVKVDSFLSTTTSSSYTYHTPTYELSDRAGKADDSEFLTANSGYTNETKINLRINLGDDRSTSAASGYNSFKLSGAKFIPDETDVVLGNYHIPYQLSDDNTVITLKDNSVTLFDPNGKYIVIRGEIVTIKNIELNSTTNGTQTVSITTYDLAGWNHPETDATIILDTEPPAYSGPFTATYTNADTSYDSDKTIYPHANGESAAGETIGGLSTFLTSKKINADSSNAAVLGIRATDNISLFGDTSGNSFFMKYLSGNKTKAEVLKDGIFTFTTANAQVISSSESNTETNSRFNFGLGAGTYSAVIVDKAGNTTDVFKFQIQSDTTGPVLKDSENNDLNKYVYLESPDTSAGVYKNQIDSFSDDGDFAYRALSTSDKIRTKKYITKKTSGKYKIILNLAAEKYTPTNSTIMLANGTEPTSGANYGELTVASGKAPIEEYAVATSYYYFPHENAHGTAYTPTLNSTNDWHKFKNRTDSAVNTDTYNGIVSYVAGNNLIIELPQQNTAPVSVFLKDACGNHSSMTLGLQDDGETLHNYIAPSFIVDDRLGFATAENGIVTIPYAIQFPYMVENSSGSITWNGKTYYFDQQSGNAEQTSFDGQGGKFGFFKDRVKQATYYNPDLAHNKLSLCLHYWNNSNSSEYVKEPATFGVDDTKMLNLNDAEDKAAADAGKYTVRAMLYCTQDPDEQPSYETITGALTAERDRDADAKHGDVTEWSYVQENNNAMEARILLDYPKPDYGKLGWTVNETNHEPKPYYIWYLLEDRVGNYEIAKLVNSNAGGDDLIKKTSGMYDKWLYDNKGPEITIRGTTDSPESIASSQTDIERLVAKNNGYVPYLVPGSNNVFVRSGYGEALRAPGLQNENLGWGTTHHVENADGTQYYRIYEPFMDLEVSEITGIRAFAWSTSGTAPDSTYDEGDSFWSGNTQGDGGYWYPGYKATALFADIGCNHTYTGDTTNPYFSFTSDSSSYKGKYSGTKVNTVIPAQLLDTSEARDLYLHVMDWTGNISTYKMGNADLKFKKDKVAPEITDGAYAGQAVANKYYIKKSSFQPPVLRIAGKGTFATGNQDIDVDLPGISESTSGSGILGYYLGTNPDYTYTSFDTLSAKLTAKLTIPSSVYKAFKTSEDEAEELKFYVYDKVGNISQGTLKGVWDETPPELDKVTIKVGTGKKMLAAGDTETSTSKDYTGYAAYSLQPPAALNKVYINADQVTSFVVNLKSTSVNDLATIEIWQWDDSDADSANHAWVKKDTVNAAPNTSSYTISSTNISYTTSGTIFQILATDQAGNTSCQYFQLFLDNVAPTFTVKPALTVTKGSVNPIPAASTDTVKKYAYYADSTDKATIKFTATDVGVGAIDHNYQYGYDPAGDDDHWTTFDGSAEMTLTFETNDIPKIYLRDKLGNVTAAAPKFTYTHGETTVSDIDELVNYYGKTVTAPTMTDIGSLQTKKDQGYSQYWVEKIENLIVIKKDDRTGVKFTITPPDTDKTILGYIDSAYVDTTGKYSLINLEAENSLVKKTFEYSLPMNDTHLTTDVEKTYYAVNYAGMVSSTGLTVKFTYNNPKAAQNVEFVPADSTIISSDAELQTNLANAANSADKVALTPTFKSENNLYYKDGWVLLRCTLYSADDDKENPKTLKLWTPNGNSWTQCGEFKTGNSGATKLIRYKSSLKDGTRYYCYLLFQLGENQNNKNLYCTIESDNSETRKLPLFSSTDSGITWIRDNAGPAIGSTHYKTESKQNEGIYPGTNEKIKKLYSYTAQVVDADGHVTETITADLPTVHDSQIGKGYDSIKYKHGTQIIIPKSWISESSGLKKYIFKQVGESTDHPGDESFTKDPGASTWTDIPAGDDLILSLPDITTPHTHLALFLQDALGNYDVYYIGNIGSAYQQWWILDKEITASDITTTATPTAWAAGTSEYTVTVNIPVGMIVYSIAAENASVKEFKFYDYVPRINNNSHTQEQPSRDELANGWINVEYLTLKLDGITPGWSAQDVKIKINGVAQDGKVFEVPAKTIAAGDIHLGEATATETTGTYTISLTCDDGAKSQIASVTATGATATLNENKDVITLTGVPAADWENDKTVTLKIKTDKNVDLDMGTVLTVGKKTLTSGNFSTNISVGTMDTATNTCTVTFNDEGIPAGIINANGHKLLSNDVEVTSANVTYSSTDKKFTISGIPAANFTGQLNITLQVSTRDGDFGGGIIHTVGAKTAADLSDFSITELNPATWNDNLWSASFKLTIKTLGLSLKTEGLEAGTHTLDTSVGSINYSGGQGNISGNGEKLPQNLAITIRTNHGDVTWKPWGTNASIGTTGRTAFGRVVTTSTASETGAASAFRQNSIIVNGNDELSVKEAKALAKAAKKATKKAKKAKAKAKTAPVVEWSQSDRIETTINTESVNPVIEWSPSDRIETNTVTAESAAPVVESVTPVVESVTPVVESGSPVVEWERSDRIETTAATTSDKHSSTSAILVVMLAVLSSAGGAWYTLKRLKK